MGGRVEPERRLEGQQFTKLPRKYQLYLQSINSDKPLPEGVGGPNSDDDWKKNLALCLHCNLRAEGNSVL
jgi:hypothetical protein